MSQLQNIYRKAFHGTSKAALASIMERGLIPGASPGADAWASTEQGKYFDPDRGVFLSPMPTIAALFSQFAAQVRAGAIGHTMIDGGVVLEIDLSEADPSLITEDNSFSYTDNSVALIYHAPIPSSWIRCYREVTPTAKSLPDKFTVEYFEEPDLKLSEPVALGVAA